ncbi:MAG TPA: hypothetical protein PKM20_11305, partial [Nitrosomonas sp.]|nr:hypothetical protein [Nitrosomonas sp.]
PLINHIIYDNRKMKLVDELLSALSGNPSLNISGRFHYPSFTSVYWFREALINEAAMPPAVA